MRLLMYAKLYMPIFFLQGPKKIIGVYNKVLVSTIGVDNLSMPIADVNNGHVSRKFLPRVMQTITITITN